MSTSVLREISPLGDRDFMYIADRWKQVFDYPLHKHAVLELNFVEHVDGVRRIVGDSNEVLGDMDLVLITSPELEHVWDQNGVKPGNIHEVTIQFSLDFMSEESLFSRTPMKSIQKMLFRAQRGLAFPKEAILQVYSRLTHLSGVEDSFVGILEFLTILHELSLFDNARELSSTAFSKIELDSDSQRVMKVHQFITSHFKDEIRLSDVANEVDMSVSAFSRFFKLRTGKTLSEYIIDMRLGFAARQLVDTIKPVSEICYACGFNTLSNFNRLFRQHKSCSPTEFREKYHKTKRVF